MRLKVLVSVIVVICCGLAVRYLASRSQERKGQPAEAKVKVLVAKQKISPWVPIKEPEKFFVEKEVPASAAPKKALKSFEEVKDQTIALKVNPESLPGGSVRPGTHVDVVYTPRCGPETKTKTILQNMLVLAVDTKAVRDPESPAMIGQTVTLAATPEEALQLAWAASTGYLRLVPLAVGDWVPMPSAKPIDLGRPAIDWIDKPEPKDDDTPPPPLPPLPPLPAVPEAKDDDGTWKAGRIAQSADDPDVTRTKTRQATPPAPDSRGAGRSSRIK